VRRLLASQRLYGAKIGFVWALYPDDIEAFKQMRRPPGRPRKPPALAPLRPLRPLRATSPASAEKDLLYLQDQRPGP
jgi:hypothetical protein